MVVVKHQHKRLKERVILFEENTARIYINPDLNLKEKLMERGALVNPNLSKVKDYPPHKWKYERGEIVPKTTLEGLNSYINLLDKSPKEYSKIDLMRYYKIYSISCTIFLIVSLVILFGGK